ncbi:hypothetical protein ACOME3_007856 [Neoechinorhynchus agilis]
MFLYLLIILGVQGDVYFLNPPRGSNNRKGRQRFEHVNERLLFQSGNIANGGYGYPMNPISVIEGSVLRILWMLSPSPCSSSECSLILQYMCKNDIKEHENTLYWKRCSVLKRANTDREGVCRSKVCSPENPQGIRYGNECADERAFFPSNMITPWKTIAVFTSNSSKCSEILKFKTNEYECSINPITIDSSYRQLFGSLIENTKEECENSNLRLDGRRVPRQWRKIKREYPDQDKLVCLSLPDTELPNHEFDWVIPEMTTIRSECTLRIRYNISSFSSHGSKEIFEDVPNAMFDVHPVDFKIFEDRSHSFQVIKRPKLLSNRTWIYNVNVGGDIESVIDRKRPRFIPDNIIMGRNHLVHIQWTSLFEGERCDLLPLKDIHSNIPFLANSSLVPFYVLKEQFLVDNDLVDFAPFDSTLTLDAGNGQFARITISDYKTDNYSHDVKSLVDFIRIKPADFEKRRELRISILSSQQLASMFCSNFGELVACKRLEMGVNTKVLIPGHLLTFTKQRKKGTHTQQRYCCQQVSPMDDKLHTSVVATDNNTAMDADDGFSSAPQAAQMTVTALRRNLQQMTIDSSGANGNDPKGVFNSLCPRCGQIVYPVEKIGPIKGLTYHRVCFKCIKCDRQLDLKTYFTNAEDLQDKQIYCQNHFPRSNKGCVDFDNLHLRGLLQAPKLSVIHQLNFPKPSVDGRSVGIAHAVQAQNLLHNTRDKFCGRHLFPALPPEITEARKQIAKYQRDLEERQKLEEDELYKKFVEERRLEEDRIEREVETMYERGIRKLKAKYQSEIGHDAYEKTELAMKMEKEKKELERSWTLEKGERTKRLRRAFMEKAQNQTAALVARQSEEMLELIRTKEQEMFKNLVTEDNQLSVGASGGAISFAVESRKRQAPPPPSPPTTRKHQLYTDITVIEHVDAQAIEVAQYDQSSYTELVSALTSDLSTELEKARAIFRWITDVLKDLNCMSFDEDLDSDTPMGLLRGIKYGTETYHTLFMRLCSYAGLDCVNIKGHSKSFGYEPGYRFDSDSFLNTWNAVLIDGEWRFVQCNWGARHLVMCKDSKSKVSSGKSIDFDCEITKTGYAENGGAVKDKIEYEYDEHYFLTDPDEFIFEFFPFEPRWQLLPQPLTIEQFEQLPFVRSLFFHYSLDFINQKQAVIIPSDRRGSCDIKLKIPSLLKRELVLHCQLRRLVQGRQESEVLFLKDGNAQPCKLERFVLHTTNDDIVSFNIHLPAIGDYYLEIFANLIKQRKTTFGQSFKLRCVCKYKVCCRSLEQSMHPLPPCAHGEWGPEKAARHYGWTPVSHPSAIIETIFSTVYILFKIRQNLKFHCKLHECSGISGGNAIVYAFSNFYGDDQDEWLIVIKATLPMLGQYGLDIYAREVASEGNTETSSRKKFMSHCCRREDEILM